MLTINGKDYELRYPMNTLCAMCDAGIDVMHLTELRINIKVVRELFMYGLKHENKKITQAQAGDLMDAFVAGTNLQVELKNSTESVYFAGTAQITSVEVDAQFDDVCALSIELQGVGPLKVEKEGSV